MESAQRVARHRAGGARRDMPLALASCRAGGRPVKNRRAVLTMRGGNLLLPMISLPAKPRPVIFPPLSLESMKMSSSSLGYTVR